jgi:hypothetical protein
MVPGLSVENARDLATLKNFEPALRVFAAADLAILWQQFSDTQAATWINPTPYTMGLFWQWMTQHAEV